MRRSAWWSTVASLRRLRPPLAVLALVCVLAGALLVLVPPVGSNSLSSPKSHVPKSADTRLWQQRQEQQDHPSGPQRDAWVEHQRRAFPSAETHAVAAMSSPSSPSSPTTTSSPPLRRIHVAVATLITSSHRTPDGIVPSIDGAFVLRQSILRTLPPQETVMTRELRSVGLPSYSPQSAHPTDGAHLRHVSLFRFPAHVATNTNFTARELFGDTTSASSATEFVEVELRFVALITPEVPPAYAAAMERIGYEHWAAHSPINASEIRNVKIRDETLVDGAMGIQELTKLEGLRMTDFDKVLMVDCDVMFHRPFWTAELLSVKESLAWTKGGWESERMNGGFLVFSPKAPGSAQHLNRIVQLLREGDFRPGTGWKGRGIGWTYGGRTIQGILPYYFLVESPLIMRMVERRRDSDRAKSRFGGEGSAGRTLDHSTAPSGHTDSLTGVDDRNQSNKVVTVAAHREISRCRYNNMVQLPPCKATPFFDVISNHFTGDCVKPWFCHKRAHPLCQRFVDEWLSLYRSALETDGEARSLLERHANLRQFARAPWSPGGGTCPSGAFASLAQHLV